MCYNCEKTYVVPTMKTKCPKCSTGFFEFWGRRENRPFKPEIGYKCRYVPAPSTNENEASSPTAAQHIEDNRNRKFTASSTLSSTMIEYLDSDPTPSADDGKWCSQTPTLSIIPIVNTIFSMMVNA